MPSRLYAIATCSCGAKWGDSMRAARSLDEQIERVVIFNATSKMVQHWRMGHRLTGHDPKFAYVIAKAAQEIAIRETGYSPTRRHAWNP